MIKISNLTFEYPANQASNTNVLNQINLTIEEGESIGIMGANGSGKTTLALCLNGLLQPAKGDVWIDDENHLIKSYHSAWD